MKILGGALRGQKISSKLSSGLRPTSDKVRKAIFDILQGRIENARVLDLYSGTGALAIEALSLGAKEATLVEMDKPRALKIEENLKRLGLSNRAQVLTMDALEAVRKLSKNQQVFDLIFLDPPYKESLESEALAVISRSVIFSDSTLIVAECHMKSAIPETMGSLKSLKTRSYGDTKVVIYGITSPANRQ